MNKEQKTLKSCYILDRLREWFELYGNQNHQRAEEELHLAIDELYEYQQKDQKITDLEAKLAESEKERELDNSFWKQECDSLQKTLVEKDKEIENLTEELDDKNFCRDFVDLYTENRLKTQLLNENWKDKISFAIQQLEKVKELCREKFNWWENSEWEGNIYDKSDVSNAYFDIEANIEEQIKQLKELK